jgi:predicted unusual protein kinase regulating ubiquinone biosynthesis (AarF/ABC1/UbiB family)
MTDRDDPLREKAVSTSRLGRLVSTGRSAAGLAATFLRGRDGSVDLAAVEALVARLGELRGLGMKIGQLASFIDPSLPPEARALLSKLQREATASEAPAVRATLEAAFGARAPVLLAGLDPRPIAVASIGQVHRASLPGVGALAVKVRHPGIDRALAADFSTALGGVGLANAFTFGLATDARALLDEARTAMLDECDFGKEAAYQRAFAAWLARDAVLVVPEVIDAWSTEAVLTTRWEPGLSLEAFLATGPTQAERDVAAAALFRASVGGFHHLGLLHADPHPGNFAFRDGRVVLYDFGCVRRFSVEHTRAFAAMAHALREGRRDALLEAAARFGFRVKGAEQAASFERFARAFFAPMLARGPSVIPPDGAFEVREVMKDKLAMAKLGLPRHLLFLLRLRFGLYAVLSRLGARLDWGALELAAAEDARAVAT